MVNKIINVSIKDRQTIVDGDPFIICGNSDYVMRFEFDAEWDNYQTRTARFVYTRRNTVKFQDVIFTGNEAQIPALFSVTSVTVGVFAGNLRTTTPARIPCRLSVRCGTGSPDNLTPSQYDRIMELLASLGAGIDITGATAGQVAQIAEVDENGAPTAWQPADLPKVEIPPLIVSMTPKNGQWVADHTRSEIVAHVEKGGSVGLAAINNLNAYYWSHNDQYAIFRDVRTATARAYTIYYYIDESGVCTDKTQEYTPPAMTGATADADGVSGLVPAPAAGDDGKFLRGDGTWGKIDITDGGGGGWTLVDSMTITPEDGVTVLEWNGLNSDKIYVSAIVDYGSNITCTGAFLNGRDIFTDWYQFQAQSSNTINTLVIEKMPRYYRAEAVGAQREHPKSKFYREFGYVGFIDEKIDSIKLTFNGSFSAKADVAIYKG